VSFTDFMQPKDATHRFLDHHFGNAGDKTAMAAILTTRPGVYDGKYLYTWLGPILAGLGVTTFADLKITPEQDPGMSLPSSHQYRLMVHTSDISRGQLVHLPWDYDYYGQKSDDQKVVDAVRASMSIPFFFEPVTFTALATDVDVPSPSGGTIRTHYDGGEVTWVDGGMLRNFPINAFDREDGAPPRWPTIGVKLSSLQTRYPATAATKSTFKEARGCLHTMMNEWDAYAVDAATAGRTIFVDNGGIATTQFDLSMEQQNMLFLNGVSAATQFVIEMGARGHVPRTESEGRLLLMERKQKPPSHNGGGS
jgi:NTE family protein